MSGCQGGQIMYWLAGDEDCQAQVNGHEGAVACLAWHPLGHAVGSGGL